MGLGGRAQSDEASRTVARQALEELCRAYWYPLYAFVRHRGHSPADAQDLTQTFFARFIASGGFASADRERRALPLVFAGSDEELPGQRMALRPPEETMRGDGALEMR